SASCLSPSKLRAGKNSKENCISSLPLPWLPPETLPCHLPRAGLARGPPSKHLLQGGEVPRTPAPPRRRTPPWHCRTIPANGARVRCEAPRGRGAGSRRRPAGHQASGRVLPPELRHPASERSAVPCEG